MKEITKKFDKNKIIILNIIKKCIESLNIGIFEIYNVIKSKFSIIFEYFYNEIKVDSPIELINTCLIFIHDFVLNSELECRNDHFENLFNYILNFSFLLNNNFILLFSNKILIDLFIRFIFYLIFFFKFKKKKR
jgi:hypothetical protein